MANLRVFPANFRTYLNGEESEERKRMEKNSSKMGNLSRPSTQRNTILLSTHFLVKRVIFRQRCV